MNHKQQADQMVNEYRMILMNEDTECGNEILCTMIAVKCALVGLNYLIKEFSQREWQNVKTELEKMSNKQQTAVDWLINELHTNIDWTEPYWKIKLESAKEMEKKQITEGFKKGLEYWNGDEWKLIDIEQYYKETYE